MKSFKQTNTKRNKEFDFFKIGTIFIPKFGEISSTKRAVLIITKIRKDKIFCYGGQVINKNTTDQTWFNVDWFSHSGLKQYYDIFEPNNEHCELE